MFESLFASPALKKNKGQRNKSMEQFRLFYQQSKFSQSEPKKKLLHKKTLISKQNFFTSLFPTKKATKSWGCPIPYRRLERMIIREGIAAYQQPCSQLFHCPLLCIFLIPSLLASLLVAFRFGLTVRGGFFVLGQKE